MKHRPEFDGKFEKNGGRRQDRYETGPWRRLGASGETLFPLRAAFWWIFGSDLGPRISSLGRRMDNFGNFLATCCAICDLSPLKDARGACRDRFGMSWRPSWNGFWEDFWRFSALLRSFAASSFCYNCVPSLPQISNQSLFCRRCLAVLCRPSVAGATVAPSVLNNLIFWSWIHCVNLKAGLILHIKWKSRKNFHSCIAIIMNRCLPSRGGRHEP